MPARFLPAAASAAGALCLSTAAYAYVAALPAPVPAAFERPMSPFAACAAEAQERFLTGPAFDSFMQQCGRTAVADICGDAAAARKLTGRKRAAFTRKCAADFEQAER